MVVGIFQLEMGKLNFTHDALHVHLRPTSTKARRTLARLIVNLRLYIFISFSLSDAMR